jgi:exodeoxyribonuclease III
VRLATWNVNSLKQRLPRVEGWLTECDIDVLCLQETKVADTAFPSMALAALGYDAAHCGEGRWNGVAILSRTGVDEVTYGFADGGAPDAESRLLTARCGRVLVVTVYVPNGRGLQEEHYRYKLAWLDRLEAHVAAMAEPTDEVVVCGDFNIAPSDLDVWDPLAFQGSTHVSPPEREAFRRLLD